MIKSMFRTSAAGGFAPGQVEELARPRNILCCRLQVQHWNIVKMSRCLATQCFQHDPVERPAADRAEREGGERSQ